MDLLKGVCPSYGGRGITLEDSDNVLERNDIDPTYMFQQKALPYIDVLNTWFTVEQGKRFVVVGQAVIDSPIITYFDVYDDTGERADQYNGKIVYTHLSQLMIGTYLGRLLLVLDQLKQTDLTNINKELEPLLSTRELQSGMDLYQDTIHIYDQLNVLHEETIKIVEKEHVEIKTIDIFLDAWSAFWNIYQSRLDTLFLIHEQIIKQRKIADLEGTPLEPIFIEASIMIDLFAESIPSVKPVLKDIDDLIELHWELGRIDRLGLTKELITPFEFFSTHLFRRASRWSLWFILPIILILTITSVVTLNFLLYTVFAVIVIYSAHLADKVNLQANLVKRLKDYRKTRIAEQPLIQQKYSTDFPELQEKVDQELMEDPDEFMTFIVRPGRWLLGLGIILFIIGLGLLDEPTDGYQYGYGSIAVGTIFIVMRILLPYWPIAQRRFLLYRDKLVIGKHEHYLENLTYIEVKRNGKIIKVHSTERTQEMIFKVKKEDRNKAIDHLEQWSILNDINIKL